MRTLFVDPGVTCCGWAVYQGRKLIWCGLSRTKEKDLAQRARAHVDALSRLSPDLSFDFDRVVIEKPQVYQQRFWEGDPGDLIDLAVVVGAVACAARKCAVSLVLPKEWKGQVPTEVLERRLPQHEKEMLQDPLVLGTPSTAPPSLRHNIVDAISMGIWFVNK